MKNSKKLLAVILVLGLLMVAGCQNAQKAGPSKTVDEFFRDYKAMDFSKIETHISKDFDGGEDLDLLDDEQMTLEEMQALEGFKALMDSSKELVKKTNYKVLNEKVDGDEAEIEVEVTFADAAPAITTAFGEFLGEVFALAFSSEAEDMEDSDVVDLMFNILARNLDALEAETKTINGNIYLVNEDAKWLIKDFDESVVNSLLFGFLDLDDLGFDF